MDLARSERGRKYGISATSWQGPKSVTGAISGRIAGWMCACGVQLDFKEDFASCSDCKKQYKKAPLKGSNNFNTDTSIKGLPEMNNSNSEDPHESLLCSSSGNTCGQAEPGSYDIRAGNPVRKVGES